MSVNAISSPSVNPISNAASNYVKQVTGTGSSTSSALQEASETPATTAQEAAKGDPVAKRLLVREQQQTQFLDPTSTQSKSQGTDNDGDNDGGGHLDTKG